MYIKGVISVLGTVITLSEGQGFKGERKVFIKETTCQLNIYEYEYVFINRTYHILSQGGLQF